LAAEIYLDWLTAKNIRTAADTRGRLNRHFLSKFGDRAIMSLTKTMLYRWLASMVVTSDDAEEVRRSKDSANRVLSMVKALLNHAVRDPSNGLTDDSAWRFVRPFHGVSKPRDIRYTGDEVRSLVASAGDEALANLITGAYLTGARYGELAEARVSHFDARTMTLRVNVGKTGTRTIILQTSAAHFFKRLAIRRTSEDFLFVRGDGSRWKRSDQTRPIKDALKKAGLAPDGSIYALRHTYVSHAIEGGVPLNIIADNCGTSVRMIEKTYAKILAAKRRDFIERGAPSLATSRLRAAT
jgi:integrase